MIVEQRTYFASQLRITRANIGHVGLALLWRKVEGGVQHYFDPLPIFRCHFMGAISRQEEILSPYVRPSVPSAHPRGSN